MNKKKRTDRMIVVITVILIILQLNACESKEKSGDPIQTQNPVNSMNSTDTTNTTNTAASKESGPGLNMDKILDKKETKDALLELSFDYNTASLVLYDYGRNETVKTVSLEREGYAVSEADILKLTDGYAVLEHLAKGGKTKEITDGLSVIQGSEGEVIIIQFYDTELKLSREFSADDIFHGVGMDAAVFSVSESGRTIVCASGNDLYLYGITDGKTDWILDETKNGVYFEKVCFTKEEDGLVFYGSKPDDPLLYYGTVNLKDGSQQVYSGEYAPNGEIYLTDKYAYFNDAADVYTNASSGEVYIFDYKTGKSFVRKVEGRESTMARITWDNKYLITGLEQVRDGFVTGYVVRRYEIASGKVLNENTVPAEADEKIGQGKGLLQIVSLTNQENYYVLANGGNSKTLCYLLEYGGQ